MERCGMLTAERSPHSSCWAVVPGVPGQLKVMNVDEI